MISKIIILSYILIAVYNVNMEVLCMGTSSTKVKNKAFQAVQIRTNIRFKNEISYSTLAEIFKNPSLFNNEKHLKYFLAFFESCYPSLIKKFMKEQNISRKEVMTIFK